MSAQTPDFPQSLDMVCIGSALQDVFVDIPEDTDSAFVRSNHLLLALGSKISIDYPSIDVGGGGTNCAVNFAIQDLSVALFSRIAYDGAGRMLLERLIEHGIYSNLLQVDQSEGAMTGKSVILNIPGKDRIALVSRGVSHKLNFDELDWDKLAKSKWIYVASFGSAHPEKDLVRLGEFAVENNIKIAFNPGASQLKLGAKKLGKMVSHADILIMNLTEAILLTESSPKERIVAVVERLSKLGPKLAVITNGRNGVFAALNTGERYFVTPPVVNARCTLGAGDAFASTLTASLIKEGWETLPKALERATMNSALVVQNSGAQLGLEKLEKLDVMLAAHNIKAQEMMSKVSAT